MKALVKTAALKAIDTFGLNAWARGRHRDSLVVLNYHGVLDGDFRHADRNIYCNTVGTEEFSLHLEFLSRCYQPVRAVDVEAWLHGERDLPARSVLLTFDDGLRNNLTHAAPILRRYGVPAIIFLSTAYMGSARLLWPQELYELAMRWPEPAIPGPEAPSIPLGSERSASARELVALAKTLPVSTVESWMQALRAKSPLPPELPSDPVYAFLSWDEAAELTRFGFEIGSHTVNHWILTRCTPELLRTELEDSRREIERWLGTSCTSFCYPNGTAADWSSESAAAVKQAGYRAAYALSDRIQRRTGVNAFAIDRLMVPGSVSQAAYRTRVSGMIEALRSLLRG